jgi:8-oxo-dGTP pyrophosphatase MutT (NUDIX family)
MILGAVVLIQSGSRILCIDCKKGRGHILPGGAIEKGEDFHTAAKRELKEETGYISNRLEFVFGGPSNTTTYTYCFAHRGSLPDQPAPGDEKVVWSTWDVMFDSEFGAYYRVLADIVKDY